MSDWEDDDNSGHAPMVQKSSYNDRNMMSNDNWDETPAKQYSSQAACRSFQVDKRHVGIVIGRGGANIREVEQRFNVKMKIGRLF